MAQRLRPMACWVALVLFAPVSFVLASPAAGMFFVANAPSVGSQRNGLYRH